MSRGLQIPEPDRFQSRKNPAQFVQAARQALVEKFVQQGFGQLDRCPLNLIDQRGQMPHVSLPPVCRSLPDLFCSADRRVCVDILVEIRPQFDDILSKLMADVPQPIDGFFDGGGHSMAKKITGAHQHGEWGRQFMDQSAYRWDSRHAGLSRVSVCTHEVGNERMITEFQRARAFWLVAPHCGELRSERLTPPGPHEVQVRTLYTGISRGTESRVFRGEVPPSQYPVMRAPFQQGEFPGPVKYGYCNVGLVEVGPPALRGQTVFCLYPHQDRYVVPVSAVTLVPVSIPAGRAVLAANLETALNVLWDASPRLGDRITVIGAGVVGCLIARLTGKLPGCRVQLLDVDPGKADIAALLGVRFSLPEMAEDKQDIIIHASGAPAGLAAALKLAGFEATVIEASWFGTQAVPLPLGEDFHVKRLRLHSSQVGHIATAQRSRWNYRRRMATVMELLDDPILDGLISGESPFAALPQTMAELSRNPPGVLCHRVVY